MFLLMSLIHIHHKRQEEANIEQPLKQSKKKKPSSVSPPPDPSSYQKDLLLCRVRRHVVKKCILPESPTPLPSLSPNITSKKPSSSSKPLSKDRPPTGPSKWVTQLVPSEDSDSEATEIDAENFHTFDPDLLSLIHF